MPLALRRKAVSMRYVVKILQFPSHLTYLLFSQRTLELLSRGGPERTFPLNIKFNGRKQARSQDFAQGGGGGGASKGPLPERSKGPFSSVERAPFPSVERAPFPSVERAPFSSVERAEQNG